MDLCFHEYFAFSIEVIMYLFQYDHLRLQLFIDTDFRAQIVYICSICDYFDSWKVSLFSNGTKSVPNSNIFWSRSSLHVNLSNQKGSSIRIEKYEFVKWHNCNPLKWYSWEDVKWVLLLPKRQSTLIKALLFSISNSSLRCLTTSMELLFNFKRFTESDKSMR